MPSRQGVYTPLRAVPTLSGMNLTCNGKPPRSHPRSHRPIAADDDEGQGFIACITCGAWAVLRPVKLLHSCQGQPEKGTAGHAALTRNAAGNHPNPLRSTQIAEIRAIGSEDAAAIRKALDAHLAKGCHKPRGCHTGRHIASASEPIPEPRQIDPPALSAAQQRLAALRARIRAK